MPSRLPALILFTATVGACAPVQSSLLPHPEPAPEGVTYTFREWLPGGTPSYVEGRVVVTQTGYQVSTKQVPCRQLPGLTTEVSQEFECGRLRLAFSQQDSGILGILRYTASVAESTATCLQRLYPEGGGYACAQHQVAHGYRTEARTGRIKLDLVN